MKQRITYMDNIKVFLTCLVVAHHAAQAYGPTGGVWPVSNTEKVQALGNFFFINAAFMMGLYFFISGYFMMFSIRRKTNGQFITDRLKRLGIPLLFFTLLVFLPFNYSSSDQSLSVFYFFIDSYMNHPPMATGHLWFVASLMVYSFIYLALFFPKTPSNQHNNKPFKWWYIPAYLVILTVVAALIRMMYPIDTWRTWLIPVEVAHIPQYLSLFLIGTLFHQYQWLNQISLKTGIIYFSIALVGYFLTTQVSVSPRFEVYIESLAESLLCIGIGLALLTIFRYSVNAQPNWLKVLSDNTYGIYLVHVFVVIVLQQLMVDMPLGVWSKFLLVTVFGILLSATISFLLRKVKAVRAII